MENSNIIPTKRLSLAMKFAVSGSAIAVIGALISFFITLILKKEYADLGQNKELISIFLLGMIVHAFLGILWTCTFAALAPLMKRIKSKALAINFIVFGALGFIVWLFGLVLPMSLDMYLSGAVDNSVFTYTTATTIDPIFNHLRQIAGLAIIPGLITMCGWVLVFVAGIIGVTANKTEFANNKIKKI